MSAEVVPLPDYLSGCGCPNARSGMHLTSCVPAREYAAKPLSDHPEYELGKRFSAIRWVYPLHFTTTVHVDVDVDPLLFIAERTASYEAFEMEPGFEEWEKPMVFISKIVEEAAEPEGMWTRRPAAEMSSYVDDIREHPAWTAADTERLHAALPKPVDPNQGTLGATQP